MADIDDFDIDRSIEQAWTDFANRLAEVISMIDESGDLLIGTEWAGTAAPQLRLSSPRRDVIRCEAVSNAGLDPDFQLSPDRLAAMEQQGWHPPSAGPDGRTPNFWIELPQEESEQLASLVVSALRDGYGVPHPVFLAPDQLAEVLQPAPVPIEPPVPIESPVPIEPPVPLELVEPIGPTGTPVRVDPDDLTATWPDDQRHLDDLVTSELTQLFGHPPIRDAEGDVAMRVGSTMLFLRTAPDGQEVVIFAAVVHDVEGRSRAAEVLNDLNVHARWVKFQLIRDRVFVTLSVLARPFVPAHLHQGVRIVSDVADGIDDQLAAKLRGRTTFSDRDDLR